MLEKGLFQALFSIFKENRKNLKKGVDKRVRA